MIRAFVAYVLALVLTVTSFSFAQARGTNPDMGPDMGVEMVICTGVGLTTISVGADGQPIETTHVCPDAAQLFAASFVMPQLVAPEARLVARMSRVTVTTPITQHELSPSARGPPARV